MDSTPHQLRHVLVVGASQGIGLETVTRALSCGHRVRAFARSAQSISLTDARLEKVAGDALSSDDVAAALDGVDAVIQTLGIAPSALLQKVSLFSETTKVLVPAMQSAGVARLIAVTGFGAGDSRAAIPFLQRLPFHLIFGRAYADKDIQEALIERSGLEWTIVRPGVLTRLPASGRYRVLVEPSEWRGGIVSRKDVAAFIVRQLVDNTLVRKAPVVIG